MDSQDSHDLVPMATNAVGNFSAAFTRYLDGLGLPSEGVLADESERSKALTMAPDLVELLDSEHRAKAMYVSKFIAACGAGLFDAALNFIWDEVVVRLRSRVAQFDLEYFYDTAVPNADLRKHFKSDGDLPNLADSDLILGALKCGILSDISYRHLDYIRDMRNWASAAHPNSSQLTGLQLLSWFETCVKEVILKEPEGPVLVVGRLLSNLRSQSIKATDVPAIAASVRRLPDRLLSALLRSLFGLYCDPRLDVRIRSNLQLVAKDIWGLAPTSAQGEAGLQYASYSANADIDRKARAHEFLELVDGLTALPEGDLALGISQCLQKLETVHDAMNNFQNEPAAARDLRRFIRQDGSIPTQVNDEYVRVLLRCRIGRRSGVSNAAVDKYDEMIDLFQEPQMKAILRVGSVGEIVSTLESSGCARRFRQLLERLRPRVVDRPLRHALDFLINATDAQMANIWKDSRFTALASKV